MGGLMLRRRLVVKKGNGCGGRYCPGRLPVMSRTRYFCATPHWWTRPEPPRNLRFARAVLSYLSYEPDLVPY